MITNHNNNPTNTTAACTLDAIYLRPSGNIQASHDLLDLNSGRVITGSRVIDFPITDLIVKTVKNMARDQQMTTLKLNWQSLFHVMCMISAKNIVNGFNFGPQFMFERVLQEFGEKGKEVSLK